MYFNNKEVEEKVLRYQLLDPKSEEANYLSNLIMKEVANIIRLVILTHKLHKRKYMTYEHCYSTGLETCFLALSRYDPTKKKKNGKPTDFFTYMSLAARWSIYYESIREYGKRNKNSDIDVQEAIELDLLDEIVEDKEKREVDRKHSFLMITPSDRYNYNLIMDLIEADPAHGDIEKVIRILRKDHKSILLQNGRPCSNKVVAGKILHGIYDRIKDYEINGKEPIYINKIDFKPPPKPKVKVLNIQTKEIYLSWVEAISLVGIDNYNQLTELQ